MLFVLLSPAKKLEFGPIAPAVKQSQPALLKDTAVLAARAKTLTARDIARLMDVSPKLAELNAARFQAFDPANRGETRPAVFAFAGEVYQGLAAKTLSADDLAFAQDHVGILSGLYGLLRPLDAIQPYRLEMGSALKTERGKDLHAFWRETLTAHLNKRLAKMKSPTVVNLASDEYFGALDAGKIAATVIAPAFKEIKNGKPMALSFFFKRARGLMARYIVQNRLTDPAQIKTFNLDGYAFDTTLSARDNWVFSRKAK
ncbi:MAG: peroxide stress protein YaaA [Rhodospirillaceae bacterium]|nr:peroxide stress protein YaaA [Rhodospirillaceae bacterium]